MRSDGSMSVERTDLKLPLADRNKKILVFGIGNLVQSDDGFGVHIIREMLKEGHSLPSNVELLDAGTSIIDQLGDLMDADRLICVDVADGGSEPGTIYRFSPEDITYQKSKYHHAHKINIFDTLEMIRTMKKESPETTIIAVQPEIFDWGITLSPTLQEKVAPVIRLVLNEIDEANEKNN